MATTIHPLAEVHPSARIGNDVQIGPFCLVGPEVELGDGSILESHVVLKNHTIIGRRNRFGPGSVIGGDPQDKSFTEDVPTGVEIGDDNVLREGVTVNRGAQKEDFWTRIGNRNLLMSNAHVAHNCRIFNDTIIVNGVLLGGHVHVQDKAIISGNTVVHHFATIGTLAFISGGCRAPRDVPPYILASGNDNPTMHTINLIGMRRAGISNESIRVIKRAHRLIFRENLTLDDTRAALAKELNGVFPIELTTLLAALELSQAGKQGRGREVFRDAPRTSDTPTRQQKGKAA